MVCNELTNICYPVGFEDNLYSSTPNDWLNHEGEHTTMDEAEFDKQTDDPLLNTQTEQDYSHYYRREYFTTTKKFDEYDQGLVTTESESGFESEYYDFYN